MRTKGILGLLLLLFVSVVLPSAVFAQSTATGVALSSISGCDFSGRA